ncbi:MAG: 50S ribosomal protein L16 3-hydroxylase [Paraglaciecola sp.]|jgi:50S ribosomal protein L16 3-hydroxylase
MYNLSNFNQADFLAHYWQQKPAIFRQAFSDFNDPLDEHELAGLAQDPNIDSRIVALNNDKWQVNHGPFDEFTDHCQGAWSLLVQAVDQHIPAADNLIRAFNFIPYWRMDDLMVSFSNKGAGVGPHLDQYDVFIVQGKGSRRWQVGAKGEYPEHFPHDDLRQIKNFTAIIDEILQPGDMLYIPPGYPHNGEALEDCLNYSVGFRAPSQQELLTSFADYAIDNGLFKQRYKDQALKMRPSPGQINLDEVASVKNMLKETIDSSEFATWVVEYFSHTQLNQGFDEIHNPDYQLEEIFELFEQKTVFERQVGIRPVYLELTPEDAMLEVFIEGQSLVIPLKYAEQAKQLLQAPQWQLTLDGERDELPFWGNLLLNLINIGAWLPQE